MRRKLVLLPGLDGTGKLSDAFVTALGPSFAVVPISYPARERLSYRALTDRLRPTLPENEPFLLLAESFAGPLAVALASARPPGLQGLILCASFACSPHPFLASFAAFTQLIPFHSGFATACAARLLLGKSSTPERRHLVRSALLNVAPGVLAHRLAEVASVDVTGHLSGLGMPLLYLQATEDRLVPRSAGRLVASLAPQAEIVRIDGPHALLLAQPVACAAAVTTFDKQRPEQR